MKNIGDQDHNIQSNVSKNEELIKCMSKLPTYLERHDNPQDKVLRVGVLDWDRLEKWQCNQKHYSDKTSKLSASSSDNSSFFSTDLSSDCSSRCNRSPARQKIRRPTLLCHLNSSPHKSDPQNVEDSYIVSSSKGKMKILERGSFKESRKSQVHCNIIQDDRIESRKNIVLLPTNGQKNGQNYKVPPSAPLSSKFKDFGFVDTPKILTSSSRNRIQEEKKVTRIRINATSIESLSCVNPKASTSTDNNVRSQSPARRLIASLSRISRNSDSREVLAKNGKNPSEISSYNLNSATSRSRSSPLRRLLDPLLKPKTTNSNQVADVPNKDPTSSEGRDRLVPKHKQLSTQQALLQISTKKNGIPMFTFAVENNTSILAATVRITEFTENTGPTWIYTFFTVEKTKRKSGIWLNQTGRVQGEEYVPNVVAQMKVSEKNSAKEFVLFDTDSGRLNVMEPNDEVAAIVVRKERGLARSTVILPGGNHGLPEKGEPWPLIDRWKSGGLCDCGGWDLGCRVRVLADRSQAAWLPAARFELFSQQGEVLTEKPVFSLSTLKNGIFSAEFSSALSHLQVFSICIALLDSRRPIELSE
jgi:hypothetical protein